uniref:Uncharacterized protein n=1 Tax=Arundo donax TaxID=35708 RepID=A0A0A8XVL1_ARUDO
MFQIINMAGVQVLLSSQNEQISENYTTIAITVAKLHFFEAISHNHTFSSFCIAKLHL